MIVALMVVLVMHIPLIITTIIALLVLQIMRASIVHMTVALFVKYWIVILIVILVSICPVRIVPTVHSRVRGLNFKLVVFCTVRLVFRLGCRVLLHVVQQIIRMQFLRFAANAFVGLDAKDKLKNLSIMRQNDPNALDLCMCVYIKGKKFVTH